MLSRRNRFPSRHVEEQTASPFARPAAWWQSGGNSVMVAG
jgi:hypothetical protein